MPGTLKVFGRDLDGRCYVALGNSEIFSSVLRNAFYDITSLGTALTVALDNC